MTSDTREPLLARKRITFRVEMPQDESFLCRLYASTRTHEMSLTGWPPEAQEAFLRQQFQFQTIHYHRYYPNASFQVILIDDRPGGRIYVDYESAEILLIDIALLPEHRGAGIGGWILGNLLDEAARNRKRVTLHVEPHNPALRLYQRLGFHMIEEPGLNAPMSLLLEWRPESNDHRGPLTSTHSG